MNSRFQIAVWALAIVGSVCRLATAQESAAAIDHAAVLAPFLSDDTLLVTYVDLAAIDPPGLVSASVPILNLPLPDRQQAEQMATAVKGVLDNLRAAGVRRIYVVWGVSDALTGPLVVIPLTAAGRDAEARKSIQELVKLLQAIGPRSGIPDLRIERHASGALIMGTAIAVERYGLLLSNERADLITPLARLTNDGAATAAVVSPGPDTRRVIRELWPQLPPPLADLTGPLLADRLRHIEVAIKLSPDLGAYTAIEPTDAESAAKLQQLLSVAQASIAQIRDRKTAELLGIVASSLDVRTEGSRIVVRLPTDKTKLAAFGKFATDALNAAREKARRNQRANQFMRLMVAMLNHESAKKTLPPAAICDAEGKPLLSWRVAVLPYLGEQALYRQFHLNEPWDSPHNITLLTRMPQEFADQDPKFAALARDGKTTYQVPVGPETIFYKNDGTRITEVSDGTSQTIALVEVVPERAVEWTKPADWEVNLQNPQDGVRRDDRPSFTAARCDGSVQDLPTSIDAAKLRALLTRAGQEPIDP